VRNFYLAMPLTGRYILNQNCVLNRIFREKVSDSEALLQAVRFVRSKHRTHQIIKGKK